MRFNWKSAAIATLVVAGIAIIVAWEIRGLFEYQSIERIGGHVAHLSSSSIGDQKVIENGNTIRFDRAINDRELATIESDVRSLPRLHLDLHDSKVTSSGIKSLDGATNIHSLDVSGMSIGNEGLSTIASLTELVELNLSGSSVTDAGLSHLKALKKLRFLYLIRTQITDEGLVNLSALPALHQVWIGWGQVTPEGAKRLRQLIPNVQVTRVGPPYDDPLANERVTAQNGAALPDDGGPIMVVLREYCRAWQEGDVYTLKKLSISASAGWYRNVGKEYRDVRPTAIQSFSGFSNEHAATVIVEGPSRELGLVRYKVQLKREDGQWKIAAASLVE